MKKIRIKFIEAASESGKEFKALRGLPVLIPISAQILNCHDTSGIRIQVNL